MLSMPKNTSSWLCQIVFVCMKEFSLKRNLIHSFSILFLNSVNASHQLVGHQQIIQLSSTNPGMSGVAQLNPAQLGDLQQQHQQQQQLNMSQEQGKLLTAAALFSQHHAMSYLSGQAPHQHQVALLGGTNQPKLSHQALQQQQPSSQQQQQQAFGSTSIRLYLNNAAAHATEHQQQQQQPQQLFHPHQRHSQEGPNSVGSSIQQVSIFPANYF